MARHRPDVRLSFEEPPPALRGCDVPGCLGHGEHRAPKARDRLNEYFWFCLDHVREYNSRWDYYRGMSDREIEQELRRDMTWQRPTWPMGFWPRREREAREHVAREFGFGGGPSGGGEAPPRRPRTPEEEARAVLDVAPDAGFPDIKARYRELAKRHHPDANHGDPAAEERLKRINQAYTTLKACYGA
jgi:DnaJ-domain-containing protein 1